MKKKIKKYFIIALSLISIISFNSKNLDNKVVDDKFDCLSFAKEVPFNLASLFESNYKGFESLDRFIEEWSIFSLFGAPHKYCNKVEQMFFEVIENKFQTSFWDNTSHRIPPPLVSMQEMNRAALELKNEDLEIATKKMMQNFKKYMASTLENNLKTFIQDSLKNKDVTLLPLSGGGSKGASGAPVFLIFDKISEGKKGDLIAVAKAFPKNLEMLEELRALQTLKNLRLAKSNYVEALNVGRCSIEGKEYALIIETGAMGKGVDDYFEDLAKAAFLQERNMYFISLRNILKNTGRAIGELHAKTKSDSQADVQPFINEVKEIYAKIVGIKLDSRDLPKGAVNDKLKEAADFDLLHFEEQIKDLYQKNLSDPGMGAIIHGDSHPGNFIATLEPRITLIDTPSLDESTNSDFQTGNAPAARDITKFQMRSLDMCKRIGIDDDDFKRVMAAFESGYKEQMPLPEKHQSDLFILRSALGTLLKSTSILLKKPESSEEYKTELMVVKANVEIIKEMFVTN